MTDNARTVTLERGRGVIAAGTPLRCSKKTGYYVPATEATGEGTLLAATDTDVAQPSAEMRFWKR